MSKRHVAIKVFITVLLLFSIALSSVGAARTISTKTLYIYGICS